MRFFPYTVSQIKRIATFLYLLIFLLLFNLYFNLQYDWFGVSLIVRVYLFVFFFYMIYNYASDDLELLKKEYMDYFGAKGKMLLLLESRILPFVFIYLVLVLFTFIDYLQYDNWPWNPLLSLLNGRYTNMPIYSLLLLYILKIKIRPLVTASFFFLVSVLYFLLDRWVNLTYFTGMPIILYKVVKIYLILFFIFWDFEHKGRKSIYAITVSFFGTAIIYSIILSTYLSGYYFSSEKPGYLKRESGLYLARFGLPFALHQLQDQALFTEDISLLAKIIQYARYYNVKIQYTDVEWEFLLFSKDMQEADTIAGYLLEQQKTANAERVISYAKSMSLKDDNLLTTSENFIHLAAASIKGSEERLMREIEISGEDFTVWGMKVFGEIGSWQTIPFILPYLANIENDVSIASYNALKKITRYDAAAVLHKKHNSPDVMKAFKQFYLDSYKTLSPGKARK